MAILKSETKAPKSRILIPELPPKGVHICTCLEIEDELNFERPKFDDPTQIEVVDLTSFYFGFKLKTGEAFAIRSRRMKISLHEKSSLYSFLSSWLGTNPKGGFDTASLIGQGAQISISHQLSTKGTQTFANISTISPVMEDLKGKVLAIGAFKGIIAPLIGPDTIPF